MQVKHGDIIITAHQPAGIFYGIQTLLQMLPPAIKTSQKQKGIDWPVPCTDITDKPQFAWRGLMLAVSRHWFTKEEDVYKRQAIRSTFGVLYQSFNALRTRLPHLIRQKKAKRYPLLPYHPPRITQYLSLIHIY